MISVAVIGCGHGGQALAADLTQRGCRVTLYAHPQHPGGIQAIKEAKGILCKGLINQFVPLTRVTTDLQQAIIDSEYIFIVLPSYAHEAMFMEIMPFVKPGQTIVTLAANFASLICLKLLTRMNKTTGIEMIDIASLPYASRSQNDGSVEILAIKNHVAAASLPASSIVKHLPILNSILPSQLIPYQDVLSLGMNNTNGIAHPIVALLNAGRIGKDKEIFYFYRDGITPEIACMMEKLDLERLRIGNQLGLEMHSFLDLTAQYYGRHYDSIYQHFRESEIHNALPMCPTSLQHRYITENVACTLVSWLCLGKLANVETLVLENLINLASLLNNTNYLRTGANLVHLNLHDKSIEEVRFYVKHGVLPLELSPVSNDSIVQFKKIACLGGMA